MKYYYLYDPEFDLYPSYLELDEEYYATRQVAEIQGEWQNTSLVFTDNFFLPEGSWRENLENLTEEVSAEIFEKFWEKSFEKHLQDWEKLKSQLKIGQKIKGEIVVFYPQGVILDLGEKFYGIANYQQCKNALGAKKMYPKTAASLEIIGFDEVNKWVSVAPMGTL